MRLIGPRNGIGMLKLIVLIMAGMMLGGALFYGFSRDRGDVDETEAADAAEEEERASETLSLGEFLVNLRSSESTLRYLQAEVSIVVLTAGGDDTDKDHDGYKKAEDEEPSLPPASHRYARDVAISVLSSQSFEKLRDDPDRSKLKALLQQELDAALQVYQVRDVLFTAFVMQ